MSTDVGRRLRAERKAKEETQGALASELSVVVKTVGRWESGDVPIPSDKLAALYARSYDVQYIITGERSGGATSYLAAEDDVQYCSTGVTMRSLARVVNTAIELQLPWALAFHDLAKQVDSGMSDAKLGFELSKMRGTSSAVDADESEQGQWREELARVHQLLELIPAGREIDIGHKLQKLIAAAQVEEIESVESGRTEGERRKA